MKFRMNRHLPYDWLQNFNDSVTHICRDTMGNKWQFHKHSKLLKSYFQSGGSHMDTSPSQSRRAPCGPYWSSHWEATLIALFCQRYLHPTHGCDSYPCAGFRTYNIFLFRKCCNTRWTWGQETTFVRGIHTLRYFCIQQSSQLFCLALRELLSASR